MAAQLLPAVAPAHTIAPYQIPDAIASGMNVRQKGWCVVPAKTGATARTAGMKRLKKMGGLGKLAAMFGKGGLEGAVDGMAPGALPPGGLPGLGGGAFNLPPGFDKFSKK